MEFRMAFRFHHEYVVAQCVSVCVCFCDDDDYSEHHAAAHSSLSLSAIANVWVCVFCVWIEAVRWRMHIHKQS